MLGIIGGSGLYQIDGIKILDEIAIETPFGKPSDKYIITQYKGRKVVFLPRHGKGHKYPPHLINFRANIWGFRKLGVDKILSISAVGGINPNLNPGDFVISDQFIDFTKSRVQTFYEGVCLKNDDTEIKDEVSELLKNKRAVHIDVTDPFCPEMRDVLIKVCDKNNFPFHQKGVYAATEGPRLETSAEIKFLRLIGADIVGMTLVPEIVLARELKMHFASISVVTNLAAGISQNRLTSDEVVEMMKEKNEQIKTVVLDFIENLQERFNCECENVLKGAAI